MIDIPSAINAFVNSFSYTRSLNHPVEVVDIGPLRTIRDAPGRRGGARTEEIIAPFTCLPVDVLETVRAYQPRGRYFVDVFQTADQAASETKTFFKANGYRCLRTEPFMALDLDTFQESTPRHAVQRVRTQPQADILARATRTRPMAPVYFADESPIRVYFIEKDTEAAAWVRSVKQHPTSCYVAGVYTVEKHRRQGMASDLLNAMAIDDAQTGATQSALLATQAGRMLYTRVGYVEIGCLHIFAPRRAD